MRGLTLKMCPMTVIPAAQELPARARALTRLEDCGDPHFMIALDQLVRSINAEATPTPEGAAAAVARLLRLLINRLRFQADLAQYPEILTEKLLPPIVVCGLPRVGSTKVHRLLAESGDCQGLIFWQGFNPARVPMNRREQTHSRIAEAVRVLEWRSRLSPASNAAHYMAASEPEEDTYFLEYTLHTYWPTTYFEVSGFLHWLQAQDRDHAFLYVRQLLQCLQWQFHRESPRPWVLKSPINFGYENLLARHLPGAKFVVLHRDPADVLASTVGIVRELRRLNCGAPADQKKAGAWAIAEYSGAMRRHLAWRAHRVVPFLTSPIETYGTTTCPLWRKFTISTACRCQQAPRSACAIGRLPTRNTNTACIAIRCTKPG